MPGPLNYMALQRRPQQPPEPEGDGGFFANLIAGLFKSAIAASPAAPVAVPVMSAGESAVAAGDAERMRDAQMRSQQMGARRAPESPMRNERGQADFGGSWGGANAIGSINEAVSRLMPSNQFPAGFQQYQRVPVGEPTRPRPNALPTQDLINLGQSAERMAYADAQAQAMGRPMQGGPMGPGAQMTSQSYRGPLPQLTPSGMAPLNIGPAGAQPGAMTMEDLQRALQQQQAFQQALFQALYFPVYPPMPGR